MKEITFKCGEINENLLKEICPPARDFISFEVKTVSYKSLREYYKMLKRQDKICRKMGVRVRFSIDLPISGNFGNFGVL